MALSDAQIATVARQAGLSGNAVAIAVAVALAESRGEPASHNAIPPDNSYGLWQINMLGSLGPSRRTTFGITSNEQLYDPATNAKAMAILSNKGNNWQPWTTYTRGTYLMYLARGRAVANGSDASVPSGGNVTTVGASETLSGLNKMLDQLTSKQFWKSYLLMAAGALLVIIALFKLTGNNKLSDTTKAIGKTAIKVVAVA